MSLGDGDDGDSSFKYSWIVAVVLCVLSAVIINLGTNLQKLAWNKIQTKPFAVHHDDSESVTDSDMNGETLPPVDPEARWRFKLYWSLGFVAIGFGSLFDFAALAFGAQSVIAPLGSLTLVANMFFAQYMHGETLSQQDVLATAVIFLGCIISVAFASHENEIYTIEELLGLYATLRFVIYAVTIVALLVGGLIFVHFIESVVRKHGTRSRKYRKLFRYHRFSYAFLSGVAGAQSVLFAKTLDGLLVASFTGHSRIFLAHFGSYLVIVAMFSSMILQVYWLNCALARFDALYVVPVFQAQWIVFGVVGGGVFYGEFSGFSFGQAVAFLSGVIMTVLGVYILSQRGFASHDRKERASSASAAGNMTSTSPGLSRRRYSNEDMDSVGGTDPMATPLLSGRGQIKSYASNDEHSPVEYDVVFDKRRIELSLEPQTLIFHPSGRRRKHPVHLWRVAATRITDTQSPIRVGHTVVAVDRESVVGPRISPQRVLDYILDGPRPLTIRFRTVACARPPLLSSHEENADTSDSMVHGMDSATEDSTDRLEPFLDPDLRWDVSDEEEEEEEEEEVDNSDDETDDELRLAEERFYHTADIESARARDSASVGYSAARSVPRLERKRSEILRTSLRSASLQGPGMSPFYGIIQSWKDRRASNNSLPRPPPSAANPNIVALDSDAPAGSRRRTGSAPLITLSAATAGDFGSSDKDEGVSSAARAV
eukprot:CAMPEP_0171489180 /NCGR_PEP_ID=MMETSP0958-20121227/2613_1 /TAXON_ID=87120 /ORGANISM="Aurantiochytrium limacinum, Strain ATCCMYA-1381" /LENGTH=712 /DNA_ID=CAMNT_0012022363 /DNA_START=120 /DNA_END=2258 /DNA_ORIENTATION=-